MTDSTPETQNPDFLLVRLSAADRRLVADALAENDTHDGSAALYALDAIQASVERAEREEPEDDGFAIIGQWCATHDCDVYGTGRAKNVRGHTRVSATSTPSSAASPPRYTAGGHHNDRGVWESGWVDL